MNARRALNILLSLSVLAGVASAALYWAFFGGWQAPSRLSSGAYSALVLAIAVFTVLLVRRDRADRIHSARMYARVLVVLLIAALAEEIFLVKNFLLALVFIFQLVCITVYQMRNDPNMDRHHPQGAGFKGAIPLSFFDLFWIFTIMCVLGLAGETVVSYFMDGRWESRAGLVWGPFSPIYGGGAVLITVALNRIHDRNPLLLFAVAGVVGAGFEWFGGWFWETAFGIVAWSYQGQPGSLGNGHTSVGMAVVWGLLGLAWMKLALPLFMKAIDRIPLHWRVSITTVAFVALAVDGVFTLASLDCWFRRTAGIATGSAIEQWFSLHFSDDFMQRRFETMNMWPSLADR